MKKSIFLVAILAMVGVATAVAQPRAIGVNLGWGADVSYQHGFGEKNMLDIAVCVPQFSGIGAKVTYDWINPFNTAVPWNEKGQWNWYLGVGGAGGLYSFSNPFYWYAGVAAHVGIEYQFWFPLQLSLDWRPNFGLRGYAGKDAGDFGMDFNTTGLYDGISLGVRYLF